jgi:hypothetical protein
MEKVNYLQRRVVFLENELADAARSASHSDDEDDLCNGVCGGL